VVEGGDAQRAKTRQKPAHPPAHRPIDAHTQGVLPRALKDMFDERLQRAGVCRVSENP